MERATSGLRESGNNSVQVLRSAECSNTNTELLDRILLPKPKKRVKSGKSLAGIRERQQGLTKGSIKRC